MRNVMKRRRVLSRGPNPYAAILATNPDLFVGLEYNVIGSRQVLWQDAAGTATPVTEIDDPIGCVRHPITGAIVAIQATADRRPLWKGPGEGAYFDGADDYLGAGGDQAWVPEFGDFYLMASANIVSFAANDNVFSQFSGLGDGRLQMQMLTGPDALRFRIDGSVAVTASANFPSSATAAWLLTIGRNTSDSQIFSEIRGVATGEVSGSGVVAYANTEPLQQNKSHIGGLLPNNIRFPEMRLKVLVLGLDISKRGIAASAML